MKVSLTWSPYFTTHPMVNFIDPIGQSFWRYRSHDLIKWRISHSDVPINDTCMRSPLNSVYKVKMVIITFFLVNLFLYHGCPSLLKFLTVFFRPCGYWSGGRRLYLFSSFSCLYKIIYIFCKSCNSLSSYQIFKNGKLID